MDWKGGRKGFLYHAETNPTHGAQMPRVKPHSLQRKLDMEIALSHLRLNTIDETQTAFAMSDVNISESTAFRWREMARTNSTPPLFWEEAVPSIQNHTPDVKLGCFTQMQRICMLLFRRSDVHVTPP
jgi:hypothetical protein